MLLAARLLTEVMPVDRGCERSNRGPAGEAMPAEVLMPKPPLPPSIALRRPPRSVAAAVQERVVPVASCQIDLAELEAVAATVGPRMDELNAAFREVEEALNARGLQIRASIRLRTFFDQVAGIHEYENLAFLRSGSGWRFYIEEGFEESDGDATETELVRAPRELRILAAEKLGELVQRMIALTKAEAIRLEAGAESVRALARALRGGA